MNNIEAQFAPEPEPAKVITLADKSVAMLAPDGTVYDRAA